MICILNALLPRATSFLYILQYSKYQISTKNNFATYIIVKK
jgi:hypothetical protein